MSFWRNPWISNLLTLETFSLKIKEDMEVYQSLSNGLVRTSAPSQEIHPYNYELLELDPLERKYKPACLVNILVFYCGNCLEHSTCQNQLFCKGQKCPCITKIFIPTIKVSNQGNFSCMLVFWDALKLQTTPYA